MRRPSNNPINMPYGAIDPSVGYTAANPHLGTDFSFQPDDRVYAPEGGRIVFVGWMGTAGNTVELAGAGGRKWRFCHLQSFNVSNGATVGEGHVLGIMGSTGYAFGRHLHLVLMINGQRHDPMSVLPHGITPGKGAGSLMTPNFIREVYYGFYGWYPSQADIDFHMAKSTPESFVNGFAQGYLWKTQQAKLNEMQNTINALNATIAEMQRVEADEDIHEAEKTKQLDELKARSSVLESDLKAAQAHIEDIRKKSRDPIFEPVPSAPGPVAERPKTKTTWLTKLILIFLRFGKKK